MFRSLYHVPLEEQNFLANPGRNKSDLKIVYEGEDSVEGGMQTKHLYLGVASNVA